MTNIDPKRARLVLPNGDDIPLRQAMPKLGIGGFAPDVLVTNNVVVRPDPIDVRAEGFAPEVIVAPAEKSD